MSGFLVELAAQAAHSALELATRYARGVLEQQKRARESGDETAARHRAEDADWALWLAETRVRAARSLP